MYKQMNEKHVTQQQTTNTEIQTPDLGQTQTYIMWRV